MKKLIYALIFLLFTASPVYAEIIDRGNAGGCGWELSDTGVVTFFGDDSAIRNTDSLWDYIYDIKEIVIEDGVTGICDYAFESYYNLTKVTIPNSVKSIGEGAFAGCSRLTTVNLGDGIEYIGMDAFMRTNIVQITIPSSVKEIGQDAFLSCSSMESVTIENGVERVGESAFEQCQNIKTATIGAKIIGDYAFAYCSGLETVTITSSTEKIGKGVFSGCYGLDPINLAQENQHFEIADNCLYASGTKELIFYVDVGNKSDDENVINAPIIIPSYFTAILPHALSGTIASTITFHKDIETVDNGAFAFAITEEIIADAQNKNYTSENGILFNKAKTDLIAYPTNSENTGFHVPDGVTTIKDYAFAECMLQSVVLPDSLKTIGNSAFKNCSNLSEVKFGSNLQTIGNSSFENTHISSIILPDSLESLGDMAFYGGCNLSDVNLGYGLKNIGNFALGNLSAIDELMIPASVKIIKDNSFYTLNKLTIFSTLEEVDSSICMSQLHFVGTKQDLVQLLPQDIIIDYFDITYHSPATISFEIGNNAVYGFESVTVKQSSTPLLPTSVPTKNGFKFLGWATSADSFEATYQPGNPINIGTENVKLYALWQPLNHTNNNFRINSVQYSGDVLRIDVTKGSTISSLGGAVIIGLYDGDKQVALHYDTENTRIQHMFTNLPAPKNNYIVKILYFDTENLTPYTEEIAIAY